MSPERSFLNKIDPLLQDKLANASDNEILRVVMRLRSENQVNTESTAISPADFPNRIEYRQALIAQRQKQLAGDVGATKKAIANLVLETYGGVNTSSLVVEGTVEQILQSLDLSGIESATLDRGFVSIVPPQDAFNFNALESIFLEIAQQVKTTESINPLNRIAKLFGRPDSEAEARKQIISQAVRQYASKYYQNHGTLQVLGMRQKVKLESIYTNVRLLTKSEVFSCNSIEELERNERQNRWRFVDNEAEKQVIPGLKLANQEQYLMVLGAPGSGKSTFLRKVALAALKGRSEYRHALIPVFIELKRFNDSAIDIIKIIADEFANYGLTQSKEYVTAGLDLGKFLIILDGLDEVPTKNLASVIEQINNFVQQYQKNRFIISCRIALNQSFIRFKEVVIADFNQQQIRDFISNWFSAPQDKQAQVAERCWELLQANENAQELAKTPLLLTFLCLVYERGQNFPQNRSELYGKALRILLEEWAAEKRIEQNEIYQGLNRALEEILLAEIAYDNFVKDKLFFTQENIIEKIESFHSRNINAPEQLNGKAVLNAIALQQGILVERAANIYAFSHLTLQEYLTARHITDNDLIADLVSNHVTDQRWREVFLLVAGLMRGGADKLLQLMEQEARNYLQTPTGKEKLLPILQWAETITQDSTGEIKPVAKRAISIAYAYAYANAIAYANTYAYSYAYAYAYAYANTYAYAIANVYTNTYAYAYVNASAFTFTEILNVFIYYSQQLQTASVTAEVFTQINFFSLTQQLTALKDKIPDRQSSTATRLKFINTINQLWLDTFQLTPELVKLSLSEAKEIDQTYFYINWLIIQCQQAAVKVTPETWQEIEAKMLRG
ncbi:MAG: NACHT domain-containing protein [Cyanobacteria bacterium P01_G01_bin.39]